MPGGVSFKTKFYSTLIAAMVVAGFGYAYLIDTSPPGTEKNRKSEAVQVLITWTPDLKQSDGPGVSVYVRTDPGMVHENNREYDTSPYQRTFLLYAGQTLTVTAHRLVIQTLSCTILRGKERVSTNAVAGGGKITCSHVGTPG